LNEERVRLGVTSHSGTVKEREVRSPNERKDVRVITKMQGRKVAKQRSLKWVSRGPSSDRLGKLDT